MTIWKIVADSSCDLRGAAAEALQVSFAKVPLKIQVGDLEFVDNDQLDPLAMMDTLDHYPEASSSACPSPQEWYDEFVTADQVFAVTISSALSGSYNSAMLARDMVLEAFPEKKIHVVDSRSTSGQMILLICRLNEWIGQNKSFDEIVRDIEGYNQELRILFVLSSFKNLAKNGRINKFVGILASKLNMRVVGQGSREGKIDMLYKSRGEIATMQKLVEEMGRQKQVKDCPVVIAHCGNPEGAKTLKSLVEKAYHGVQVTILTTGGLTSYYAEKAGLIVAF